MGSSIAGSRAAMIELANKLDMMGIGGSSSAGAKMAKNYSSLSAENSTAPLPAVPNLILRVHGHTRVATTVASSWN
jgi:hypothetical protein